MVAYEAWQNALVRPRRHLRDLFVESPFAHPSVLFRRDVVERAGGYRQMGWPEDYDLCAAPGTQWRALRPPAEVLLFGGTAPSGSLALLSPVHWPPFAPARHTICGRNSSGIRPR
jgi:hypothetical protein